jgi:hypothetical protein
MLARAPYVEVVEPLLPNVFCGIVPLRPGVGTRVTPHLSQHLSGKPLFQHLHHLGRIAFLRFADQKVKVLGHDHVSHHHKFVGDAGLFQDLQEQSAPGRRAQSRTPLIATARDQMKVLRTVVARESGGHEESIFLGPADEVGLTGFLSARVSFRHSHAPPTLSAKNADRMGHPGPYCRRKGWATRHPHS